MKTSPFYNDVIAGLSTRQKTLPCKYFYDAEGSELFEEICDLEEYYVTRTEMAILRRHLPDMAQTIGAYVKIMEFGAGSGIKTELLLAALNKPSAYVPIDISQSALSDCAKRLKELFPHIAITPIHDDYMRESLFNRLSRQAPYTVFFPGSTLGNFETLEAILFLKRLRKITGKNGGVLIGVDLMKNENVLIPAYDDSKGVTAAFNKNLLRRINNELEGTFDLDSFSHRAVLNTEKQRVEMHLVSLRNQVVRVGTHTFHFTEGESIHTENSHKYTLERFRMLAENAGFEIEKTWLDENCYYSMHYLRAA
ncbi:MAG: L-histidine N(alpha)-methyltransferase [Rickettsiales bacterium]